MGNKQNPDREKGKRTQMKKKHNRKNRQQRGKQEMRVEFSSGFSSSHQKKRERRRERVLWWSEMLERERRSIKKLRIGLDWIDCCLAMVAEKEREKDCGIWKIQWGELAQRIAGHFYFELRAYPFFHFTLPSCWSFFILLSPFFQLFFLSFFSNGQHYKTIGHTPSHLFVLL